MMRAATRSPALARSRQYAAAWRLVQEVTPQVYAYDGVPLLDGGVHEHPVAQNAGVVHHHVEAAKGRDGCLDEPGGCLPVGHVRPVCDGLAALRADLFHDLLGCAGIAATAIRATAEVVHDDLRPLARKSQRVFVADAAGTARHDHDASITKFPSRSSCRAAGSRPALCATIHRVHWDDLRYFLSIARSGSLTDAARELAVSYSTVSRRLNALEEALGVRLFERLATGFELTPAGTDMLGSAERMEAEFSELSRRVLGRDARLAGHLRLATTDVLATSFMPDLAAFTAATPRSRSTSSALQRPPSWPCATPRWLCWPRTVRPRVWWGVVW